MKYDDLFVCKFPKALSKEEIFTLYDRMKQGDMEAREKLINHNIGLVVYCVKTDFKNTNYNKKELVSIGCIGLIKAVDTYDISKGNEFSSYAWKCITNEINMFFRKCKSDSKVSSFDDVILFDNDGNDVKLEDVVPSKVDIERDYVEKEHSKLELKLLKQSMEILDERSKKVVMLYFGFFDDKVYAQKEISNMLNISQPHVSRIMDSSLKKIKIYMQQLELGVDVEKIKDNSKIRKKGRNMVRFKTIYEYFSDYTKIEVDEMIKKLSDAERELLRLRFGDLGSSSTPIMDHEQKVKFYKNLVPKMKRLLAKTKNVGSSSNVRSSNSKKINTIYELLNDYTREEIDEVIEELSDKDRKLLRLRYGNDLDNPVSTISKKDRKTFYAYLIPKMKRLLARARDDKDKIEDREVIENRQDKIENQSICKSDYVNMLEMLKTPTFNQMLSILSVKEAIIVSLRFGYVDGKYFDTKAIASFLDISEDEVRDITMKALLLYKENINNFIDKAINIVSDNTLKRSKNK